MILILFLFPLVTALWIAVLCLWLVYAGNNSAMESYRALISDRLRKIQISKGFLLQCRFTGAGEAAKVLPIGMHKIGLTRRRPAGSA
jgi:maltose/moltooligosaccharide transporter